MLLPRAQLIDVLKQYHARLHGNTAGWRWLTIVSHEAYGRS
jgi:hypothetical protein